MRNLIVVGWILAMALVTGCQNIHPWNMAYFHQPPLHDPAILDYKGVVINTNDTNVDYSVLYKTYIFENQVLTNSSPSDAVPPATNSAPTNDIRLTSSSFAATNKDNQASTKTG